MNVELFAPQPRPLPHMPQPKDFPTNPVIPRPHQRFAVRCTAPPGDAHCTYGLNLYGALCLTVDSSPGLTRADLQWTAAFQIAGAGFLSGPALTTCWVHSRYGFLVFYTQHILVEGFHSEGEVLQFSFKKPPVLDEDEAWHFYTVCPHADH